MFKNVFDATSKTIGDAAGLNAEQVKLVRLALVVGACYAVARYAHRVFTASR